MSLTQQIILVITTNVKTAKLVNLFGIGSAVRRNPQGQNLKNLGPVLVAWSGPALVYCELTVVLLVAVRFLRPNLLALELSLRAILCELLFNLT